MNKQLIEDMRRDIEKNPHLWVIYSVNTFNHDQSLRGREIHCEMSGPNGVRFSIGYVGGLRYGFYTNPASWPCNEIQTLFSFLEDQIKKRKENDFWNKLHEIIKKR